MVSMLGAFAGAGVLEGLGSGMMHERNLKEATDLSYQQLQNKESAEEKLAAAKAADASSNAMRDANKRIDTNTTIKAVSAAQSAGQQAEQLQQQPQQGPMPGTGGIDAAPQGPIKPSMPPLQQQQPQAQAPVQGQPSPQQPQTGTNAGGPLNSPQGGPVPIQSAQPSEPPIAPPSKQDIHPTSPAGQLISGQEVAKAAQTQDPHDIASIKAATFNGTVVHQVVDEYNNAHSAYPNIPPQQLGAIINQYADPAKHLYDGNQTKLYDELGKLNEQATKNVSKEPIGEDKLSPNEQTRYAALKANGDMPQGPITLPPITPVEQRMKSTARLAATRAEDGTANIMDSLVRQAGLQGKYTTGYGANTIADVSNTVSSWLGSGQSDKSAAAQQMMKDTFDQITGIAQSMPPGTRQGFQMTSLEGKAVADTAKGVVPNLNIINSMMGKALTANQAAYLQRTQGLNEPQEHTDLLIERYKENNPVFEADGKTPNSNWMPAKDWIEAGGPKGSTTSQSTRVEGKQNITTKLNAAEQGQNPSEVGNKPAFDYSKIEKGQTYTAPDGTTRTKQ